jgi:hypothetical protein
MEARQDTTLRLPAISAGAADPNWVREALDTPFVQRAKMMFAALWLFLRAPRTFGEAWSVGSRNVPNPVVAMTAAVSIVTLIAHEARRFFQKDDAPQTLLRSLGETIGPYFLYIGLGLFAHFALRVLGSKRRLRTTVGVALLAGAGPGTIVALGIVVPAVVAVARFGSLSAVVAHLAPWAQLIVAAYVLGIYIYSMALFKFALAGAHGLPRWKGLLAGTFAVIAMGIVCGRLESTSLAQVIHLDLGPHLSFGTMMNGKLNFFAFTWSALNDAK